MYFMRYGAAASDKEAAFSSDRGFVACLHAMVEHRQEVVESKNETCNKRRRRRDARRGVDAKEV